MYLYSLILYFDLFIQFPEGIYRFTSTGRPKKTARKRPRSEDSDEIPSGKKTPGKTKTGPAPKPVEKVGRKRSGSMLDQTIAENDEAEMVFVTETGADYEELNSVEKSEFFFAYWNIDIYDVPRLHQNHWLIIFVQLRMH